MKALLLKNIGEIEYTDVEYPTPSSGEVIIKVFASGICGSDIQRVYKDGAHNMPLIIGHEFSGQVVEAQDEANAELIGKRVGVFPLIPCKKCRPCLNRQYEMCKGYSYLGSRTDGGFAEYVKVPVWNLIELPDSVSYEEAAMLEPMAVASHAIRRIEPAITSDDNIVVCGLGTIGTLLVMLLRERGYDKIFVAGNKDFQRQNMLKLGIPTENYCDIRTCNMGEFIAERTGQALADVYFECVGSNESISWAFDNTAAAGRVCLVGNPHSDMIFNKNTYWKILRNQLRVTGTWNSSYTGSDEDDWHYVLKLLENKKIHPADFITHKYELKDIINGLEIMRDKTEDYIKIMAVSN